MKQSTLNDGKRVFASDAYKPREGQLSSYVGRQTEQRMATAAWMGDERLPTLSPVLVGEPGVGNNRLVYELD